MEIWDESSRMRGVEGEGDDIFGRKGGVGVGGVCGGL